MSTWILYAVLAAVFAGLTSVLAKCGMAAISADLGLAIRTCVVCVLVLANLFLWKTSRDVSGLSARAWLLLAASGATTALSWIFYYRAMKLGPVSYVATIDKGSIIITLALSSLLLGEVLSPKLLLGAGLVLAGLLVLAWK